MAASRLKALWAAWYDPQDPETLTLRRGQLRIAATIARGGPLQMFVVVGFIAALALEWHEPALVGLWAAAACGLVGVSDAIAKWVKARIETDAPYRILNAVYVSSSALVVISVASAPPLFWIEDVPEIHLFLLLLLLIGPSIAVAQQACHPPAAVMATLYVATAIVLCLREGETAYFLLAAFALVILAMLGSVVVRISNMTVMMLKLRESELALVVRQTSLLDQQRELVAQLREANEAKSHFLARMSHELRTPLNAVIGFSDVMMQESMGPVGTPVYLDYLKHINSSGAHLLELINDILDLSKLEAGHFELREGIVDLWEVVEGATAMVQLRAEAGGVRLVNAVRPGITLQADETAVRQIVLNVVANAIKFTPSGGEVVWSALHALDGDVVLKLRDSGVGIRPEDIERVFEPFGQSQSGFVAQERGTGLGLPIVRTLMQLHGGEATLESVLGAGTTVALRFPATRVIGSPDRIAA